MEAQQGRSSGFDHNAWTQDGTDVKGMIHTSFIWNLEQHVNFE